MSAPAPVTTGEIRAAVTPILDRLRQESARRDAERVHPYAEIRALADAGILRYRVPAADGGAGASVRQLAELIADIAAADSNVAQALRPGFLVAESLVTGTVAGVARQQLLDRVLRGELFSGTANENSGAAGSVRTTLSRDADGLRIDGAKYYSTGGLHADWFSGTARDEQGRIVGFTVPTDRDGVERLDDFDAIGQRLTASGSTLLHGVRVEPAELSEPDAPKQHPHVALAHLILAATLSGIAAAARDDAVRVVREVARPIKHSTAVRAADDPYVRQVVGRIGTAAFTARAQLIAAAEALDRHWVSGDEHSAVEAVVAVAEAYIGAGEQALRAAELLFDVGGGTLTGRDLGLDRHWRNARTVANHNPRGWKAAAIGAWLVSGEAPPANGLF
ncbi:acyl-CoA dehydrogenase family protein [Mycetocola reblochoni]|uniref:Acyl-CoA dehydrogenase n=2 Tax=Mycetocola reblochoni TaxID=331618 RepID=A0A3L6ZM46_9MICO|nr:acyl-CoA dehydrogenase family protein [Mycetocola reblochoni]RLP68979.1 acyl-CoA dehydrogenase [Mycetocola reblochoni]SJN18644.1 Acyl-CoA dehydrogenase; probable dibenzothiophene desulfurization enzyme [Mycetocola reblochoni REB411]